uniref:Uncharacterized protein n=1 Tax=Strigamia maritima TaxID=126957 RepID=T1JJ43_STRMM
MKRSLFLARIKWREKAKPVGPLKAHPQMQTHLKIDYIPALGINNSVRPVGFSMKWKSERFNSVSRYSDFVEMKLRTYLGAISFIFFQRPGECEAKTMFDIVHLISMQCVGTFALNVLYWTVKFTNQITYLLFIEDAMLMFDKQTNRHRAQDRNSGNWWILDFLYCEEIKRSRRHLYFHIRLKQKYFVTFSRKIWMEMFELALLVYRSKAQGLRLVEKGNMLGLCQIEGALMSSH